MHFNDCPKESIHLCVFWYVCDICIYFLLFYFCFVLFCFFIFCSRLEYGIFCTHRNTRWDNTKQRDKSLEFFCCCTNIHTDTWNLVNLYAPVVKWHWHLMNSCYSYTTMYEFICIPSLCTLIKQYSQVISNINPQTVCVCVQK